ncbi:MAG: peptide/nickel transport system substrate-binding protein, partial [Acidimicrobiia bacterium]|nr:peptide/nickel transport system substrate-binding protein [Acidimicrobiia bacterium]
MALRTRPWVRLLAALAGCAMVTAACGGGGGSGPGEEGATPSSGAIQEQAKPPAAPTGTLRMTSTLYPLSLDPQRDTNFKGTWFYPMYDSLTMQDAKGEPQPWLATSWQRPDPTTWRFKLRTDVVFHDGSAFDATVVKKNIERTKSDKASPHASIFAPVSEVVVVDPQTVDIRFSTPSPAFPLEMSNNAGMMVSGKAIDSGADLTRSPAGSGGWIWDASKSIPNQSETYNANPNYWNKAVVHVQQIVVTHINDINARHNALESGQIDIVDDGALGRKKDMEAKGFRSLSFPVTFEGIIIMDRAGKISPELANPKVREAITWLIDREGYLSAVHNGEGSAAAGLFPPGSKWHDPSLDKHRDVDVAKAKKLLGEAGYPNGFSVRVPSYAALDQKLGAFAQMLAPAGIKVELVQVQSGVIAAEYRQGKWAIGYSLPRQAHAFTQYAQYISPKATYNAFALTDLDDLATKAQQAAAL